MGFSLDAFRLDGRVAWVTGGNRGLGLEMAKGLAAAGAKVAVTGRSPEATENAARQIAAETGAATLGLVGDVTSPDDVAAHVDKIVATFGSLDILVNNAGINIRKPVDAFPLDEWRRVIETNLVAPFICCQHAVPHMKERGWGRIINTGSMMGSVALPERSAYCASKGGIHMMTKALALELAPYHITVNAIAPGPFLTEMNSMAKENPEINRFFTDRVPMSRWGEPEEVVGAVVYLASEASRFVTGAVLAIDGGWTSQ